MTVIALADLYGIVGRRDELVVVLARSERESVVEPGCRRYVFAATLADPEHFVLVSEWDSVDALDAHYDSEAFASFQFDLDGLLARPSELTIYSTDGGVRPVDTRPMDPRDAD